MAHNIIAGYKADIRIYRINLFDQPSLVLPESLVVKIGKLNYCKSFKIIRQISDAYCAIRNAQTVIINYNENHEKTNYQKGNIHFIHPDYYNLLITR